MTVAESSTLDISLERIAAARTIIDPALRNTPQYVDERLNAVLGRRVLVKVETLNPLRSFKGRGADFLVAGLDTPQTLVCGTSGNFGQGIAYAARRHGMTAEVFMATDGNPGKKDRIRALGAVVHETDDDVFDAAREYAEHSPDRRFVQDGDDPAIAEGAGTIGAELLEAEPIGTVVVPVGDGALITGIARWVKAHAPGTRIVGVCPTGAQAMAGSWQAGRVRSAEMSTIAEGLAIRTPVQRSLDRMLVLVDDIVLVDDDALRAAMVTAADTLGLILEPAGAASLAAIATHDLPGETTDTIAAVLTGGNARSELLRELAASL